ncbi:MAG: hypothetical protein ACTHJY_12400, partial [Rhizobiaceae bacterium]
QLKIGPNGVSLAARATGNQSLRSVCHISTKDGGWYQIGIKQRKHLNCSDHLDAGLVNFLVEFQCFESWLGNLDSNQD